MARRTTNKRNQQEQTHPDSIIILISWILALTLTWFHLPGLAILPISLLIAKAVARPPVMTNKDGTPATPKEEKQLNAYRNRQSISFNKAILPTGPQEVAWLTWGILPCWFITHDSTALAIGLWIIQLIGTYLTVALYRTQKRTLRRSPHVTVRPVPFAKKHKNATLISMAIAAPLLIILSVALGRIEPLLLLALIPRLTHRKAIHAAWKQARADKHVADLLAKWAPELNLANTLQYVKETRVSTSNASVSTVTVADVNKWIPAQKTCSALAEADGYRVGLCKAGDNTTLTVYLSPTGNSATDTLDVEVKLGIDQTRMAAMYGAYPGTLQLTEVGEGAWQAVITGSNVDMSMISRDWLKGATGDFGDWGNLDNLRLVADANGERVWIFARDWHDIEFNEKVKMGSKPTADHSDVAHYLDLTVQQDQEMAVWIAALDKAKLPPPATILFDTRKRLTSSEGWWVEQTVNNLPNTIGLTSYLPVNVRPAFADAYVADVLPYQDRTGWRARQFLFVQAPRLRAPENAKLPKNLGDIDGSGQAESLLARVYVSRALQENLKYPPLVAKPALVAEGLWRIPIELTGKVIAKDVIAAREHIRVSLGVEQVLFQWAKVNRLYVWAGVHVDEYTEFTRSRDKLTFDKLIIDDAWLKAKAVGVDGSPVKVKDIEQVSDKLSRVSFAIPAGLSMDSVMGKLGTFSVASGFMYARKVPGDGLDLLLARSSPLPEVARPDWSLAHDATLPFAVGDDGLPVVFEPKDTAHLLITGITMSGKSSAAVSLVLGALRCGWQVFVADPVKHANDFRPIENKLALIADGFAQTAALLRWLVAENTRRLALQKEHGVANYNDLPDEAKPQRILVLLDEFNSTLEMSGGVIPNKSGDPDIDNQNNMNAWLDAQKAAIGAAVGELLTQARSQGITVILAAQKLNVSDLKNLRSTAKDMLGRLFIGGGNPVGNLSQTNVQEANRLIKQAASLGGMPKGRGLYERMGRGIVMVQCYWAGSGVELAEQVEHVPPASKVDVSGFMQALPDKVGVVDNDTDTPADSFDDDDWSLDA